MSILNHFYIFNTNDFLNNIYGNNISNVDFINSNTNFDLLNQYKSELDLTTDIFFKTNILNMAENNIFFFLLMPVLLYTFIIIFSLVIEISSIRNNFIHFISFFFIILWMYVIFDVFLFNSLDYTTNYTAVTYENLPNLHNLLNSQTTLIASTIELETFNKESISLNYVLNFKKLSENFNFYGHFLLDNKAFWYIDYFYNIIEELNTLILFINNNFIELKLYLITNFSEENLVYHFFNEITFNSFTIVLILTLLFFISFLFLGFVDKFFINENKNFEFSWLLWLFLMASVFLFFSKTFIQIFICLECISFCSYILISLERYRKLSAISGVRYLVISAIPSVFLILGLIFMYKDFTTFDIDVIYNLFQTNLNIKYISFYEDINFYYTEFFTDYNLYVPKTWDILSLNQSNGLYVSKFFYNSLIDPVFLVINDVLPNLKFLFNWNEDTFRNEILELNNFINLKEQRSLDVLMIKQQLNLINLMVDYSNKTNNIEDFIYSEEYKNFIKSSLKLNENEVLIFLDNQKQEAFFNLGFGDLAHYIDISKLTSLNLNIDKKLLIEVNNFWLNYEKSINLVKHCILNECYTNNFIKLLFDNVVTLKTSLFDFNIIQHNLEISRLLNILELIDTNHLDTQIFLEFYKNLLLSTIYSNFNSEDNLYNDELFNLWGLLNEKNLRLFHFENLSDTSLKLLFQESFYQNIEALANYQIAEPLKNVGIGELILTDNLLLKNNYFVNYQNYEKFLENNAYLHILRNNFLNSTIFSNLLNTNTLNETVKIPEWFEHRFFNFVHWAFDTYVPSNINLYLHMNEFLTTFNLNENLRVTKLGLKLTENVLMLEDSLNPNKLNFDYTNISENILIKNGLNIMDYPLVDNQNKSMTELLIIENALKLGESLLLEENFKNQTFVVAPFNGNLFETINNVSSKETFITSNNNTQLAFLPFILMFSNNNNSEKFNLFDNSFYNNLLNNNLFFENSNFTFLSYFIVSILLILVFLIINFGFKVTAAPFHIWAPTIYNEGTLSSVIFLSIFTKLALFLFAINLFDVYLGFLRETWIYIFLILGLLSIIVGSFSAVNERFIKKFFVYSSMVDVGFLFLAFSFFPNLQAYGYIFLYLFVYNLSSLIIWFFISYIRNDTKFLTNLISILNKSWPIQFIFSLVIFSMAGIPPFAGFFTKLNILIGLEASERNALVFLVLLFTVLSLFYYLRLIKIIQFDNISFNFYTNFVKPNVLFFASLFIFVLIFFIFFVNQNLLVIFQESFLTSKILDIQNLDKTLLNVEFDEDHWPQNIHHNNELGYWSFGRYFAFLKHWDQILLPNETSRWIKDTFITASFLSLSYLGWTYFNNNKKN